MEVRTLLLPAVLVMIANTGKTMQSDGLNGDRAPLCIRYTEEFALFHDTFSISYIQDLKRSVEALKQRQIIRNETIWAVEASLNLAPRGLCEVSDISKEKRSIVQVILTFLGTLLLGPL